MEKVNVEKVMEEVKFFAGFYNELVSKFYEKKYNERVLVQEMQNTLDMLTVYQRELEESCGLPVYNHQDSYRPTRIREGK